MTYGLVSRYDKPGPPPTVARAGTHEISRALSRQYRWCLVIPGLGGSVGVIEQAVLVRDGGGLGAGGDSEFGQDSGHVHAACLR
jgi:hypothetical protein